MALVVILIVVAAVAILTGVAEYVCPAPRLSDVAQQFIEPDKKVNTFPITTLGALKNDKQKLEIIKVTTDVVSKEMGEKIEQSQKVYDYATPLAAALLSFYITSVYKNKTLYTEAEIQEIKNGKTA